ncbi:unnamed protein product, partial [Protopolystoma xenopodis]
HTPYSSSQSSSRSPIRLRRPSSSANSQSPLSQRCQADRSSARRRPSPAFRRQSQPKPMICSSTSRGNSRVEVSLKSKKADNHLKAGPQRTGRPLQGKTPKSTMLAPVSREVSPSKPKSALHKKRKHLIPSALCDCPDGECTDDLHQLRIEVRQLTNRLMATPPVFSFHLHQQIDSNVNLPGRIVDLVDSSSNSLINNQISQERANLLLAEAWRAIGPDALSSLLSAVDKDCPRDSLCETTSRPISHQQCWFVRQLSSVAGRRTLRYLKSVPGPPDTLLPTVPNPPDTEISWPPFHLVWTRLAHELIGLSTNQVAGLLKGELSLDDECLKKIELPSELIVPVQRDLGLHVSPNSQRVEIDCPTQHEALKTSQLDEASAAILLLMAIFLPLLRIMMRIYRIGVKRPRWF